MLGHGDRLPDPRSNKRLQLARPAVSRIAVLILFLFLASIIAAIWLAERATQGS